MKDYSTLSILIPTHMDDCRVLARQLSTIGCEVIVLDDGSYSPFPDTQKEINTYPNCRYVYRDHIIGRARTRNQLAQMAAGQMLLFLDADVLLLDPQAFIDTYLDAAEENTVVYGGLQYPAKKPPRGFRLRYRYGRTREEIPVSVRSRHPHNSFNSISFLIDRDIYLNNRMKEGAMEYGHEDTLFGMDLKRTGIAIKHIDNPVIHNNTDTDADFLRKSREAINNLIFHERMLRESSKLLQAYHRLEPYRITDIFAFIYRVFHTPMKMLLIGSIRPSMKLFLLYRFSYLCYEKLRTDYD